MVRYHGRIKSKARKVQAKFEKWLIIEFIIFQNKFDLLVTNSPINRIVYQY